MKILIYRDYGCTDVGPLYKGLTSCFSSQRADVAFTDAAEIKAGVLDKNVQALFVGGGAGNPFMEKLAGTGNERIRDYVEKGGTYFGICAGAYYACREVVFEKDVPELCVEKQYGLNLVEGRAVGTLYKELNILPYSPMAFSAKVVHIRYEDGKVYPALYHGGPWFEQTNAAVLGTYEEAGGKAAVVEKRFGWGKVILSGVHFEDDAETLSRQIYPQRCDKEAAEKNAAVLQAEEERRKQLFDRLLRLV